MDWKRVRLILGERTRNGYVADIPPAGSTLTFRGRKYAVSDIEVTAFTTEEVEEMPESARPYSAHLYLETLDSALYEQGERYLEAFRNARSDHNLQKLAQFRSQLREWYDEVYEEEPGLFEGTSLPSQLREEITQKDEAAVKIVLDRLDRRNRLPEH